MWRTATPLSCGAASATSCRTPVCCPTARPSTTSPRCRFSRELQPARRGSAPWTSWRSWGSTRPWRAATRGSCPVVSSNAAATWAHLWLALPAIVLSFVVAIPVAWFASRFRRSRFTLLLVAGLIYAIPSLPLFIVLPLILGTSVRSLINVVAALGLYGVALMVRYAADALDAVSTDALLAATAMGYGPLRRFFGVQLPLAGPALLAGLRVVAVSTVSLVPVSALLGVNSLGMLLTG